MTYEGWIDIATGDSKGSKPIQIRADCLRPTASCTPYYAWPAVDATPVDMAADFRDGEADRESDWREADLKRAISVAEEAGLQCYRVEIATDGTISIIVGIRPDVGDILPPEG